MNTRHHISINARTSLFALTALAAVATTVFAPVTASAWGSGGMHGQTPGNNSGGGYGGKPNGSTWSPGQTRPGGNYGQPGHPGGWNQGGYHPDGGRRDWDERRFYGSNGYWRRPGSYWYGSTTYTTAPVVTTYETAPVQTYTPAPVQTYSAPVQTTYAPPAYVAPVQPAASLTCNCLTKSYMPDGTVVFADNCSKETASAAPGGAQAGYQSR
jgi:hypothetical protein